MKKILKIAVLMGVLNASLFLTPAFANANLDFLSRFGKGFEVKDSYIIKNLPSMVDQQGAGFCYSAVAAFMFDFYNCQILGSNCQSLKSSEKASALDIARYANIPSGDISYESSFRGFKEGGSTAYAFEKATLFVGTTASEECLPYKTLFGNTAFDESQYNEREDAIKRQISHLDKLKTFYKKYKEKCSPENESCITNAMNDYDSFGFPKIDSKRLARSLSEDTYESFLDTALTPAQCRRAKNRAFFEGKNKFQMGIYPPSGVKNTYKGWIEEIYKNIVQDRVIGASVCQVKGSDGLCKEGHSFVIYGYAKLCDVEKCYDAVKFKTSWGNEIQNTFDDNWYNAESMWKQIVPFRSNNTNDKKLKSKSNIENFESLFWLEKKSSKDKN